MNTWKISIFTIVVLLSTMLSIEYAHAVKFDLDCIAKIPKNVSPIVSNKMRQDCNDQARKLSSDEHVKSFEKKRQENQEKYGNKKIDYTCEGEYPKFKVLGETNFRKWTRSTQINADECIALWNDPVWKYRGDDRDQKLAEWYEKYQLERDEKFKISKSKSTGKSVGNVKSPELEEIAKRLDKLENENKKLKEQINQNKKK